MKCEGDGHASNVKPEDDPQGYNYYPQQSLEYRSTSGHETPRTSGVRPLTTFVPGTYCYKQCTKTSLTYNTPEADMKSRRSMAVRDIHSEYSNSMTRTHDSIMVAQKDNARFSRWASKVESAQEAIRVLYGRREAYTDPTSKLEYPTIDIIIPEDSLRCHLDVTLLTASDERIQDSAGDVCLAGSLDLDREVHTFLFESAQRVRKRDQPGAIHNSEFEESIDIVAAKLGEDTKNVINTRDQRPLTKFRFQSGFSIIQPKSGALPGFRSANNSSKKVIPGPYGQRNGIWRVNHSYIVTMHPLDDE
ncbi:hypothetical protein I302_108074 [Kwoniella bestiolae CBS 10118]|uniref:Uncharacterized protein n=1 Tax=Kwoniella bestiolae CBS 10118 TaxID=1296100 RepID=A0A1B9FWR1_9TREE|nr:hypothetical protein I302_07560 [Kwoniella bestiolae CBS 10118]OCF23206.1 hypothetical protein I302_07560 [Kwoniella bestiolae CBS 10118]